MTPYNGTKIKLTALCVWALLLSALLSAGPLGAEFDPEEDLRRCSENADMGNEQLAILYCTRAIGSETLSDELRANAYSIRCAIVADPEVAVGDCTEAIRLNPEQPENFFNRAYDRDQLRDYVGAIADLTKALELGYDPQSDALLHRSVAYRNLGNRLLAQVDIKAAFEAASQDPDIRRAYAELNGGKIPSSDETNWSNSEDEQPLRAIIDREFGADETRSTEDPAAPSSDEQDAQ